MGAIYAFEALFDGLRALVEPNYTRAGRVLVPVSMGESRVPNVVSDGIIGRVVLVPGLEDGDMGTVTGPQQWPHPAQSLLTWNEAFRVYCWAHDPRAAVQDAASDRAHNHAAHQLLHEVIRQLWNVSHSFAPPDGMGVTSPVKIGNPRQLKPLATRSLGREYMIPCVVEQPILDMFDGASDWITIKPVVARISETLGEHTDHATTEVNP